MSGKAHNLMYTCIASASVKSQDTAAAIVTLVEMQTYRHITLVEMQTYRNVCLHVHVGSPS